MRIVLIAMMIALLAVPALAQQKSSERRQQESDDPYERKDAEKKKLAKETEAGYKGALKIIPDKKPDNDPWKNVR
jgi:hypothetical protein